jgi:hypothetical protein
VKRFLDIPQWLTVPLVAGSLAGLAALTYPGGLVSAYQDLRDSQELKDEIYQEQQLERTLENQSILIQERIHSKEQAVRLLIQGYQDFQATIERFIELYDTDETVLSGLRIRYGNRSVNELASLNVLDYVKSQPSPDATSLYERLRSQHDLRFGRSSTDH